MKNEKEIEGEPEPIWEEKKKEEKDEIDELCRKVNEAHKEWQDSLYKALDAYMKKGGGK